MNGGQREETPGDGWRGIGGEGFAGQGRQERNGQCRSAGAIEKLSAAEVLFHGWVPPVVVELNIINK